MIIYYFDYVEVLFLVVVMGIVVVFWYYFFLILIKIIYEYKFMIYLG